MGRSVQAIQERIEPVDRTVFMDYVASGNKGPLLLYTSTYKEDAVCFLGGRNRALVNKIHTTC